MLTVSHSCVGRGPFQSGTWFFGYYGTAVTQSSVRRASSSTKVFSLMPFCDTFRFILRCRFQISNFFVQQRSNTLPEKREDAKSKLAMQ
mmetsp:Transcript_5117/g.9068  ORF Transcript_5117/g.9068 Transcript_5117/m.9068 type:complete len:89 (-) Transcript_5117:50-316(-)